LSDRAGHSRTASTEEKTLVGLDADELIEAVVTEPLFLHG
jgi:hypothetical protein